MLAPPPASDVPDDEDAVAPSAREFDALADGPRGDDAPTHEELLARFGELLAAGDHDAASAMVRSNWLSLLQGDAAARRTALESMPSPSLHEQPLLSMMLGLMFVASPRRRFVGIRYFLTTIRSARAKHSRMPPLDRALVLSAASVAYRLVGRANLGVSTALSAVAALEALSDDERRTIEALPAVYAQLGSTLYYAGRIDDALAAFERGLAAVGPSEVEHVRGFSNLAMLAGIHALQGEIPEAMAYVAQAHDPEWDIAPRTTYRGLFYGFAQAAIALEGFRTEEARAHLDALLYDRRTIEHWVQIALLEAWPALLEGRPAAAKAGIDAFVALRGSEGRSPRARAQLAPMRSLLQLALGSPDAAEAVLRRDAARGPARELAAARRELALGRHGAALHLLRSAEEAPMSAREEVEHTTLEAASLLRFSEGVRARGVVDELGALVERTGVRLPLVLLPHADLERLRAALSAAGHAGLVAALPTRGVLADPDTEGVLTERERIVLRALVEHASPAAIATELVVSVNTVKSQLRSIYRKLGVSRRDDAIAVALDRHLLAGPGVEEQEGSPAR